VVTLWYEVARLKRENGLLHEELRLLKERVERLTKPPPTPGKKNTLSEEEREGEREGEGEERA